VITLSWSFTASSKTVLSFAVTKDSFQSLQGVILCRLAASFGLFSAFFLANDKKACVVLKEPAFKFGWLCRC